MLRPGPTDILNWISRTASVGVAAATLLSVTTAATADESSRATILAPVVVTADQPEAKSAAVTSIDRAALRGEQGLTLSTSLQRIPGVVAQNDYNASQGLRLSIRGFGARANFGVRGLQVRLDDVPLTLPDGQTELDAVDIELVEFVDVIRGPSATLFGNAAGGAVLIETRSPSTEPRLRADVAAGEGQFRKLRLEAGGELLGAATLGAVNLTRLDGFRDHAASDSKLFTGKLDVPVPLGELLITGNAVDVSSDDPGALNADQVAADRDQAAPRNLQFDAGERIRQQRLAASWTHETIAGTELAATSWAGQRDFTNRLPFENGGRVAFDRAFGGAGLRVNKPMKWLGLSHKLNVGIDAQLQRDDRRRFDNVATANGSEQGPMTFDQRESADSWGVTAENRTDLGAGWSISIGARRDDVQLSVDDKFISDGDDSGRRDFSHNSFSAGLAKAIGPSGLGESSLAYLRVASSFATPTFTELANPDGGGFNQQLNPAEAVNYELGLSGSSDAVQWAASIYSIRLRDELIPFELENQPGRSFFANAGKSRRNGVELSLDWNVFEHWRLSSAWSWNDYQFRDYQVDGSDLSGNDIPGIPAQQLFTELAYENGQNSARINLRAHDKTWADDSNTTRVAGFSVVNIRFATETRWGKWQLSPWLGLNNIFDAEYNDNLRLNAFGGRHFEPAPGFNVFAGVTAEL